jgi:pyrroloquinoline quinone (PQQ) biosynthesis protein C
MRFSERLATATAADRAYLVSAPVIQRSLRGEIDQPTYVEFLTQAYHHVRHTVPLLMAVGARLPERLDWLRSDVIHYLNEEVGHEQWILADIAKAGGDAGRARLSRPAVPTAAMVAFAYDTVQRGNPIGFFGMVHVLEGTSVALALTAAERIQQALGLPRDAFTYLRSHGELDQEHVQHLARILDRIEDEADREAIVDCARGVFWLYAEMFRGLDGRPAAQVPVQARRLA